MKGNDEPDLILVNALYDAINSRERGFQLGLLYISTYVQEQGYRSHILVGENITKRLLWILEKIEKSPLIGFYVSADNEHEVVRCCRVLKDIHPEIKIILGGPQARINASHCLREEIAHFVCIGDGEDCTVELLHALNIGEESFSSIPNLAYMENSQICFGRTKYSKSALDLDRFPIPRREDYDKHYLDTSMIATARGCVSKCTFCFEGIAKKLRRHSVDRVVSEMIYLKEKYSTKYFTFIDDTFTADARKVYGLCEEIKRNFEPHRDAVWYCEAKVSDLCRDEKMASAMVDAGLIRAQIGSESGNQKILDLYKKDITVEQVSEATSQLYEEGITSIFTNFIVGGVCETQKTFDQSLSLAVDLMNNAPGVVECASTFLSPYMGTDIRLNPDNYEIDIIDSEFVTGSSDSYIFAKSKHLSHHDVLAMGKMFYGELRRQMETIYPKLPAKIIRRQLEAGLFGLTSNWHQFLLEDSILNKWMELRRRGYETMFSQNEKTPNLVIPTRTVDLEFADPEKIVWIRRKRQFRLSGLELYLVELASGKIVFSEIVERAFGRYGALNGSKENFAAEVINFYNLMANEFLICFRRFT